MPTETFNQISFILNVILTLLLLFMWDRQYAKEQSVKNNLIAMRRIIERIQELGNIEAVIHKSKDLVDNLDATLATLGARRPFEEIRQKVLDMVSKRIQNESEKTLESLPNE